MTVRSKVLVRSLKVLIYEISWVCLQICKFPTKSSQQVSHEGIFFYAYFKITHWNIPSTKISSKNQRGISTVPYALKKARLSRILFIP